MYSFILISSAHKYLQSLRIDDQNKSAALISKKTDLWQPNKFALKVKQSKGNADHKKEGLV